jgi:leader peptidase (prepilin peptidase)/N-methyltransferase
LELVYLIFAVLLGLALGSFLNVCIVRLPRGESVVTPGSHCMHCGAPVLPRDNLPILSWLLLRGSCRRCGRKISLRYPLVEAATAVLFAGCALRFGMGFAAIGMAVFCWLLLGLALIDAETFLLPDAFTLPGILLGLLYSGARYERFWPGLANSLLGAAAIAAVLLLISLVYRLVRGREGMGLGDVKLGAMLGAWLGWQLGSVALFLAIVGGGLGGIVLVAMRRKSDVRAGDLRLPFGTFLATAGSVTAFAGDRLLRWYLGLFP